MKFTVSNMHDTDGWEICIIDTPFFSWHHNKRHVVCNSVETSCITRSFWLFALNFNYWDTWTDCTVMVITVKRSALYWSLLHTNFIWFDFDPECFKDHFLTSRYLGWMVCFLILGRFAENRRLLAEIVYMQPLLSLPVVPVEPGEKGSRLLNVIIFCINV